MNAQRDSAVHVPSIIGLVDPLARRLLGAGVPLGPNAVLTVRGRKSGVPRSTGVAVVESGGKRWIVGTFGETNWVRNLRAAGEADVTSGRSRRHVTARELPPAEASAFFTDVLGPYVKRLPLGRWLVGALLRAPEILSDPTAAAGHYPVFELVAA